MRFQRIRGEHAVMSIPAQRTIHPSKIRNFGRAGDAIEVPSLTEVQTKSYDRFLQLDVPVEKREAIGLEGVLQEIFPIESYDKKLRVEYIRYELGKPRYDPTECRQLRLTYGRPFRVWLRLVKDQPVEEEVYLGDMPIMIGGGEFIINGAERVVVSQLHRSPGVDFVTDSEGADRRSYSCRVIPERGSWVEINVTKKETLGVRIDQSGKFSAMTLLRAMDPKYSSDEAILRCFHACVSGSSISNTRTRAASSVRRSANVSSPAPRMTYCVTPCFTFASTRSSTKRARATIDARNGRVNGPMSGRFRHSSSGAAKARPSRSSMT